MNRHCSQTAAQFIEIWLYVDKRRYLISLIYHRKHNAARYYTHDVIKGPTSPYTFKPSTQLAIRTRRRILNIITLNNDIVHSYCVIHLPYIVKRRYTSMYKSIYYAVNSKRNYYSAKVLVRFRSFCSVRRRTPVNVEYVWWPLTRSSHGRKWKACDWQITWKLK